LVEPGEVVVPGDVVAPVWEKTTVAGETNKPNPSPVNETVLEEESNAAETKFKNLVSPEIWVGTLEIIVLEIDTVIPLALKNP
jgi:hypothetical protein